MPLSSKRRAEGNNSAYVPDLPGCVATGPTATAVAHEIREAIRFHLNGLRETDCRCLNRPASLITSRQDSWGDARN